MMFNDLRNDFVALAVCVCVYIKAIIMILNMQFWDIESLYILFVYACPKYMNFQMAAIDIMFMY